MEPLPQCRNCAALARPNILMFGDWSWLGHRTDAQQERFAAWLNGLAKSSAKLAVIELGAGVAIATVRHTSERIVERIGGKLIRIKGRGAPRVNGSGKGDVLARVRIQVPKRVNKKEKDLLEQLQELGG